MTRRLIAATVGALLTLGLAESRAQATGPGIGTPLVPTGNEGNSRVATRGANFLEIGLGARAMGMAGAYAALGEGFSAMYWNLAGTADVQSVAGGINYTQVYGKDGLDFLWGGALMPLAGGAVGIQVGQLSSGDLVRTTADHPEGGDPTFGSTFEYTGTMAAVSYARRLTDRLSFGMGVKYAKEGISNASANYVGLDLGLRFRTGLYGTTVGAALQNAGSSGKWSGNLIEANTFGALDPGLVRVNLRTEQFEMPTMFRFSLMTDLVGGAEALFQGGDVGVLRAVGEFDQGIDTDLQGVVGLEYGFRNLVFLRGGKRWFNENDTDFQPFERGLAFGGGLRIPLAGRFMQFDYAWNGQGELPDTHHFSFEFGF